MVRIVEKPNMFGENIAEILFSVERDRVLCPTLNTWQAVEIWDLQQMHYLRPNLV